MLTVTLPLNKTLRSWWVVQSVQPVLFAVVFALLAFKVPINPIFLFVVVVPAFLLGFYLGLSLQSVWQLYHNALLPHVNDICYELVKRGEKPAKAFSLDWLDTGYVNRALLRVDYHNGSYLFFEVTFGWYAKSKKLTY